jgi:hypothetical protein
MMAETMLSLRRLTRVEPRDVWGSEAGHFTPWLAQEDNLRLLGDTIGLELELEAQDWRGLFTETYAKCQLPEFSRP